MSDNTVLSQADIDALLGGNVAEEGEQTPSVIPHSPPAADPPAPLAPAVVEAPPPPAATPPPTPTPPSPAAAVPPRRVAKPKAKAAAKASAGLAARVKKLQVRSARLERTVARLEARLANLSQQLERSFGASASRHFTCESCGAHGNVATPVRCTHCGAETLWGWWPKQPPE